MSSSATAVNSALLLAGASRTMLWPSELVPYEPNGAVRNVDVVGVDVAHRQREVADLAVAPGVVDGQVAW